MYQTSATCRTFSQRRGFTLLEVLLALSILLFSLAALANLSFVGVQAATRCHLQSEACWHAYTVLEEIAAGVRKPVNAGPMPIEVGSNWMVQILTQPAEIPSLMRVEAKVWKTGNQADRSRVSLVKSIYVREP